MFIFYNPNPDRKLVDDCVIRAICKVTGKSWERVYDELFELGRFYHDFPNRNYIWGEYLEDIGFERLSLPYACPNCFTVREFCKMFPVGIYILSCDGHVIAVEDGNYYDTIDSGDYVPAYYWRLKGERNAR